MVVPASPILVVNGVLSPIAPPISELLQSISAAYTTTRTHSDCLLFWNRHLLRLADSARIMSTVPRTPRFPILSRGVPVSSWDSIGPSVERSVRAGLGLAVGKRRPGEEVAVTALVREAKEENGIDVYVHFGVCVPVAFGTGAVLALVGRGRDVAEAKYSDWARIRKYMEKLRHPMATETLLSNDGDRILEGSVTNFFVVCRKMADANVDQMQNPHYLEVQTAPIGDGVLPGVVRQLVLEVCSHKGIPVREVAPKWSDRELWEEAFLTSSLRLLQHVEMIQAPRSWEDLQSNSGKQVSWVEKHFGTPGAISIEIQNALLKKANTCGYLLNNFI